jgi:hypothetical protein
MSEMKLLYLLIILLLTSMLSCSHSNEAVFHKLNDSIECTQSPGQYYSLYIPDSTLTDKKYPIVFLFDPGGHAKKAVKQYIKLANRYSLILACPYSAKNGSYNHSLVAAKAMIQDVLAHYPVNQNMQIFAGFSGGSRFVYNFAQTYENTFGVISSGAFPYTGDTHFNPPKFIYSGIAGTSDFNFIEGVSISNLLWKYKKPFQFIVYNGKHDWPPDSVFERALTYQVSRSQEYKNVEKVYSLLENKALGNSYKQQDLIKASWILQNLTLIDAHYKYKLENLVVSQEFAEKANSFSKSLLYEDSIKKVIQNAAVEIIREATGKYRPNKTIDWWKSEIKYLNEDPGDINMYIRQAKQRGISHIGILLWEVNRKTFREKHYEQALAAAKILCLAYPENSTYIALKAESLFNLGRTDDAKTTYTKAVHAGFSTNDEYLGTSPIILELQKQYVTEKE